MAHRSLLLLYSSFISRVSLLRQTQHRWSSSGLLRVKCLKYTGRTGRPCHSKCCDVDLPEVALRAVQRCRFRKAGWVGRRYRRWGHCCTDIEVSVTLADHERILSTAELLMNPALDPRCTRPGRVLLIEEAASGPESGNQEYVRSTRARPAMIPNAC